jgi:hypothetical protein
MVTRISVDPSQDEAIAKLWNSAAGRVFSNAEVESDRVPVLLTFDMSDFLTDEERATVEQAIRDASDKITGVNWISEVRVPQQLVGRSWRFHVSGHLRADSASVVGPDVTEGE